MAITDDDLLILKTIKIALSKHGYQVSTYSDPHKAADAILNSSWDLVITDYMMPQKNGLELAHTIKEYIPDIPILFISGNSFKSQKDMFTLNKILGTASEVLGKPFSSKELITIVNELLET